MSHAPADPVVVEIAVAEGTIVGDLLVPDGATGVVCFAHGSGSSRHSSRNQQVAAARRPETVAAVVSRGGRPDLAGDALPRVQAPTLLIVGGADTTVLRLNEEAEAAMTTDVELVIVPDATHLFEEPGALERVAQLAAEHFSNALR